MFSSHLRRWHHILSGPWPACAVSRSGVPAVVDFAAMRDAVMKLGGDPEKINPVCPADLVIDHSIQVDFNRK